MEQEKVVFSTDVDKDIASIFDRAAERHFRSRSAHLRFLVDLEVKRELEREKKTETLKD